MNCPKRLSELIDLNLGEFKEKDPAWEIRSSEIAGRGVFASRNLKRGDVIFREKPLLIGASAENEEVLTSCTSCFKLLDDTKFMCRQGCGLPVCTKCVKSKKHTAECELFRSWEPNEPNIANSMVIRLLAVARALLLTKDEQELIYCLQANLDNNHRTEVRYAAKCFRKFPTDKKIIDVINRTVAVVKTCGFDPARPERHTDNEELNHRALFPLFGVLNHSCVPNTTHTFEDKTNNIIVSAAVDIAEGDELTTTYTKLFANNLSRYLFLKTKKQFICKCKRCLDPTENGSFISALYCRNTECTGLAVPQMKNLPHPDWSCLKCKQISNHRQMLKSQDFAHGALRAKLNGDSLKVCMEYINNTNSNYIPSSNFIVIDAKLKIIKKLSGNKQKYSEEDYKNKERYCTDIIEIIDKIGVGDCLMRSYLENEKIN